MKRETEVTSRRLKTSNFTKPFSGCCVSTRLRGVLENLRCFWFAAILNHSVIPTAIITNWLTLSPVKVYESNEISRKIYTTTKSTLSYMRKWSKVIGPIIPKKNHVEFIWAIKKHTVEIAQVWAVWRYLLCRTISHRQEIAKLFFFSFCWRFPEYISNVVIFGSSDEHSESSCDDNKIVPDSFVTLSKAKVCRINSNLHIRENFEVLLIFQMSSSCWCCCCCYMCPMLHHHMLYQSSDQILSEIQLRWRYFSHLSKRFLELIISTTHERVVSQLRALFFLRRLHIFRLH